MPKQLGWDSKFCFTSLLDDDFVLMSEHFLVPKGFYQTILTSSRNEYTAILFPIEFLMKVES